MNGVGLELLIDGRRGGFQLRRAGWSKPVSGWLLRPPFLGVGRSPKTSPCRTGDKELVCRILDGAHALISEFGWSLEPRRWTDVIPRTSSRSFDAFKKAYPPRDLHTVRVPVPPEAATLELERRVLRSGRVRVTGRCVYEVSREDRNHPLRLREAVGSNPHVAVSGHRIAAVGEGKDLPRRWQGRRREWQPGDIPKPLPGPKAQVTGGFDVVITGDGFTRRQQQDFIDLARRLRMRLRAARRLGGRGVRFHIVPAVSRNSGIETKASQPKDTFYEIFCLDQDAAKGVSPAGYMPARLGPFLRGTRHVGPWEWIDLVIVIVNHAEKWIGGHAWPDLKLAVVPRIAGDDLLADAVMHEASHVIGRLADETSPATRTSCEDLLRPAPNQASLRQVAHSVREAAEKVYGVPLQHAWSAPPDTIWWQALNAPLPVQLPGQPAPSRTSIGVFWGCQHVAAPRTTARVRREILEHGQGDAVDKLRASDRNSLRRMFHYRAMSDCLMGSWATAGGAARLCAVCRVVVDDVVNGTCRYPAWAAQPPVKSGLACVP